jgi:uncharacterized protein (TIGR04255 family)
LAPPNNLPKFERPPVAEVAVSIFFKSLRNFATARYGQFWRLVEKEYPKTQDQPPIIELPIELLPNLPPPLRRVFLVSSDENLIIQIQPDFFAHNWRKVKEDDRYPGFDLPKELFLRRWALFQQFIRDIDGGEIRPTRYDITYVNQIVEPQGAFPLAIEHYSPLISLHPAQGGQLTSQPKALMAELQFDLPQNLGILRASFKQGQRTEDKVELMQVDLTARHFVRAEGPSLEEWLDNAHECLAVSFVELTTPEAHKKWGRKQ